MADKKKKRTAFEQYKHEQKKSQKLKKELAIKKQNQSKKIKRAVVGSIAAVTALSVIIFSVNVTGTNMRLKKAVYSDNTTVNNAMMSYYFYNYVNDFIQNNHSEEIDTEKSLKKQFYSDDYSWYEYFLGAVKGIVAEKVRLASDAKGQGTRLTESQRNAVEHYIKNLKENAEAQNISFKDYLKSVAGTGFSEKDLRDCLELDIISSQYYMNFAGGKQYSENDFEKEYNLSPSNYLSADFVTYTFINGNTKDQTEDETKNINKELKAKAEELSKITNPEEFTAYVTDYLKNSGKPEAFIESQIKDCFVTGFDYELNSSVGKWIFEQKPKAGETTIIEGSNLYTVCLLTKEPYRSTTSTCNVRHILVTENQWGDNAERIANDIMTELEKKPDSATFADYAAIYSEDPGSKSTGGLYNNVPRGKMVTEFNDWCFDTVRKPGDMGIVKTVYGYHIMFFEGTGLLEWQADCYENLLNGDYDRLLEELDEKHFVKFAVSYNFPDKK